MACGATLTLKRNCVDFEPMHCRPAKRQCCSLISSSLVGHTSAVNTETHKSAFAGSMPRLSHGTLIPVSSLTHSAFWYRTSDLTYITTQIKGMSGLESGF